MNEIIRVLIVDGSATVRRQLCAELLLRGQFTVYEAGDGNAALALVKTLMPDAMVMPIAAMPGLDGLGVLDALSAAAFPYYPHVVVTTAMNDAMQARALSMGADIVMGKPPNVDALAQALCGFDGLSCIAQKHAARRLPMAEEQLHEIGMPHSLVGFAYLAQAISLISVDVHLLKRMTSFLYPHIAKAMDTTGNSVERGIRHAIEVTWTRGHMQMLHRIFGNSIDPQRGKPTNTECAAMLAERLREKLFAD